MARLGSPAYVAYIACATRSGKLGCVLKLGANQAIVPKTVLVYRAQTSPKQMSQDVHEVLCRKWSILILRFLDEDSPQNFSQIESEFDTSSDVISERLKQLREFGLLIRDEQSPKDVRYSITANGEELLHLVDEIHELLE